MIDTRIIKPIIVSVSAAAFTWIAASQANAGAWGAVEEWEPLWLESGADPEKATGRIFTVETPAEIRRTMANDAEPGDVLIMANGIWEDAEIAFEGKGTAEAPIVLRAETPGEVILSGKSRIRIGGEHLVVDGLLFRDGYLESGAVVEFRTSQHGEARHCRFTNSAILEYNPPEDGVSYHWIGLHGHRNRVDHNRFRGQDHPGRMITTYIDEEPNYHRIDNNHFGPRTTRDEALRRSGGAIIMIGHSFTSMNDSRTLVERNLFEHCSGHGEIISNKSNENVHRHNTFIESRGALTLRHGDRCVVEGNWFFGNGEPGTGGVRVVNSGHLVVNNYFDGLTGRGWTPPFGIMNGQEDPEVHEYFQSHDTTVVFNTFVDCVRPVILGLGAERDNLVLPPKNVTFANNLIHGGRGPLVELRDELIAPTWKGNLLYGADPGVEEGDGFRVADPEWVRESGGVRRPGDGSAAVRAAEGDFDFVVEDIAGRPRGGSPDVGAWQSGAGEAVRGPLGPDDVGAAWARARE